MPAAALETGSGYQFSYPCIGRRSFLPQPQFSLALIAKEWRSRRFGLFLLPLAYWLGSLWTRLPTVHRRLGAPFGRQPPNSLVHTFVEAQELTDHSQVQKSTVGVDVRKVAGINSTCPSSLKMA